MFGNNAQRHAGGKKNSISAHNTSYKLKRGRGVMILACFTAAGPGNLANIESTMNSALYQRFNVKPFLWQLKFGWNWIMQHDNDHKHSSKSANRIVEKEKNQCVVWMSESVLWWDLKRAEYKGMPANLNELVINNTEWYYQWNTQYF